MTATPHPARSVPENPSERTLVELEAESARLEAATLYLQEWAAAVHLRADGLRRLTDAMLERQRIAAV